MKTAQTPRESHRVIELAAEYRSKGYTVVVPQSASELPEFLRTQNYLPDLIATKRGDNLIVEVKSSNSPRDFNKLSAISDIVNSREGWHFVLVLTNPRNTRTLLTDPVSSATISEYLTKSRDIESAAAEVGIEAAFLFAWTALEATLRLIPQIQGSERRPTTPISLIRNAVIAGYLSRADIHRVERLFHLRNALVHAGNKGKPSKADVDFLRKQAESILQEARNSQI